MRVAFRKVAVASVVLIAACGGGDAGKGPAAAPTATAITPRAAIAAATAAAATSGRRVLIDFGADWCPDCHSLDKLYEDPAVAAVLSEHFALVRVDVGHFDQNMDLSRTYGNAAEVGIPALAVLDAKGTLVVSTRDGSFANARTMAPSEVAAFLTRWSVAAR